MGEIPIYRISKHKKCYLAVYIISKSPKMLFLAVKSLALTKSTNLSYTNIIDSGKMIKDPYVYVCDLGLEIL